MQTNLSTWSELTDAEAEVIAAVDSGPYGVREFARETNRSEGTVGNLLGRARDKLEDGGDGTSV